MVLVTVIRNHWGPVFWVYLFIVLASRLDPRAASDSGPNLCVDRGSSRILSEHKGPGPVRSELARS